MRGWTWEYVEDTVTPSRLRALRKAVRNAAGEAAQHAAPGPAASAGNGGAPPMSADELKRWIDASGGKIPGLARH